MAVKLIDVNKPEKHGISGEDGKEEGPSKCSALLC
jgi:hypothetical protein